MGKVINFEESVNVMKIREEGLQNLISELKGTRYVFAAYSFRSS